ncbi:hypothetical protein POTOM_061846 [Populus tomentosa]|uniref:Glycosyl hydrolase family 95 N-terminal domain-containing protein n=1 Tax=Populus tomentosa TaxID=118781 RepID=A0A8X7XSI2_POPTO|nr:hypothetical protein POTOM_061846 [Populus tomentosa]
MWNPTSTYLEDSKPLKITSTGPAKYWTDAIPIGTGRLGAMVWGGVSSELIQLNEDTLWTGTPIDYTNPDAPEALAEVRNLVDSGEFAEASDAAAKLSGTNANVYQLLGDIKLEFDGYVMCDEETYYRELDLDTATARVKYSVGDVEFTREHFASYPDQVIVTKIAGSKEGIPPKVKANDDPKGILFAAVLGLQISDGGRSDEWPFTKPSESEKDPTSVSLRALKSIKNQSYSELYSRHLDDYQNLFHRVSLRYARALIKDRRLFFGDQEFMPSGKDVLKGTKM